MNLQDFCEMTPSKKDYCPANDQASVNSVHLFKKDEAIKSFKKAYDDVNGNSWYVYYGSEKGYYIQYPAANFVDSTKCNCSKYDARFR